MCTRWDSYFQDVAERNCAASRLQRAWRLVMRPESVKWRAETLERLGVRKAKMELLLFPELAGFLQAKNVVGAMNWFIRRIVSMQRWRGVTTERYNVRVFLAGYMIDISPDKVFEEQGVLETELINAARPMIAGLESLMATALRGEPLEDVDAFIVHLREYSTAFKRWKYPDQQRLLGRICDALHVLYRSEGHLPADEPEDSQLRVGFRTQIGRLRTKLHQVGGEEMVATFDRMRGLGAGEAPVRREVFPVSHEQIVHELLLNPAFRFSTGEDSFWWERTNQEFSADFWALLREELGRGEATRMVRVIEEVRRALMDASSSLEEAGVARVFDVERIRVATWEQLSPCLLDCVNLLGERQYLGRRLAFEQGWATARVGLANAEERTEALARTLEFMLGAAVHFRVDAANARLGAIEPMLRVHGIEYMRGKFEERGGTINATTDWLTRSLALAQRHDGVEMLPVIQSAAIGRAQSIKEVWAYALAAAIAGTAVFDMRTDVPETLTLDIARLHRYRKEFRSLAACQTVLTFAQESRPDCLAVVVDRLGEMLEGAVVDARVMPEPIAADVQRLADPTAPETRAMARLLTRRLRDAAMDRPTPAPRGPLCQRVFDLTDGVARLGWLNFVVHSKRYTEEIPRAATESLNNALE